MKSRLAFGPLAVLTLTCLTASSQTPSPQNQQTGAPIHELAPSFGFAPASDFIFPKPNAPFSGVLVEQSEQTLGDGTTIKREAQEIVMRDSAGRVYRARPIRQTGRPDGDARPDKRMITIIDPVQHIQYACSPVKVCRKFEYREPPDAHLRRGPDQSKSRNITIEDLGTSTISGLQVQGKRITRVIPEGQMGNDRPITTTKEMWRSLELDVNVQLTRTDPRAGNHTATLTNVNLGEPDPVYFQIPEGYRVTDTPIRPEPLAPRLPAPDSNQ